MGNGTHPGIDAGFAGGLSAANGHGATPARGALANVSDAGLRNAIVYMFRRAQPAGTEG